MVKSGRPGEAFQASLPLLALPSSAWTEGDAAMLCPLVAAEEGR